MTSLKGLDPKLTKYVMNHRLPEVYEALLSGLIVMCPSDPLQFILDKLRIIKHVGYMGLEWDTFIDMEARPSRRFIKKSSLDYIFNFDEKTQPTDEMFQQAYSHYNMMLKRRGFNAFVRYLLYKKRKREYFKLLFAVAEKHYRQRFLINAMTQWQDWLKFRKTAQSVAFTLLSRLYDNNMGRLVFRAWYNVTLDAKRTREYFEKKNDSSLTSRGSVSRGSRDSISRGSREFHGSRKSVASLGSRGSISRASSSRLERGEIVSDDEILDTDRGECRDDISCLPKKAAVKIFSFVNVTDLARCACVCRSWKVITQSNMLWSRLDLTGVRHRKNMGFETDWVTDKVAIKLLSKCRPYLVHLNMRGCKQLMDTKCFYNIRECRNLQDINLSECAAVTDDTVKMVVEGCRILLYLNISYNNITDASLRAISKNCANLQYLSIAYCTKFTDKGLYFLSTGKTGARLGYLDMSGSDQCTPDGFRYISNGFASLHSIIINNMFAFDDICMEALMEKPRNLRYISLTGTTNLTDDSFRVLAFKNKGLTKLMIDSNQKLTDTSFKLLTKSNPDLWHLNITNCMSITDGALKSLTSCRFLTVLNLADCVRVTDQGMRYITESTCGPRLQELNLTNCLCVGDIALVNINKRCQSLAYLNLSYCEHITEPGLEVLGHTHSITSLDITGCACGDQALSALGNNWRLKDLSLAECDGITALGLQKFAQQVDGIEYLDLSHCMKITDTAMKNLAFCCRLITSLNVSGCRQLTDLAVQYLCGVCQHMKILDISGCINITDKALKYLRKGCRNMECLTMLYCENITKAAVTKIEKHVQRVNYNNDPVPNYFNY